jgi:hypothetical protein
VARLLTRTCRGNEGQEKLLVDTDFQGKKPLIDVESVAFFIDGRGIFFIRIQSTKQQNITQDSPLIEDVILPRISSSSSINY